MIEDGLLWRSIPDTGKVNVSLSSSATPVFRWQNCSVLPNPLFSDLIKQADQYWGADPDILSSFADRWIVNICADIDEYAAGLGALDRVLGDQSPIWNHPRAVALTRRDFAPDVFRGISGLEIPKVVRFAAKNIRIFRRVFEREGFVYPVLVRPVSSQTGIGLVKVSSDHDWVHLERLSSLGRHFFMTQFIDFRDEKGRYVKVRVCFIDDTISLREYGVSGNWQIGSGGNTSPSSEHEIGHSIGQLLEQMHDFKDWTALRRVCGEMIQRCSLNFWGMDIGVRSDSSFVFFEANAAMTMAVPSNVPNSHLAPMTPVYQNIEQRLRASFARLKSGYAMPVPTLSVQDLIGRNP